MNGTSTQKEQRSNLPSWIRRYANLLKVPQSKLDWQEKLRGAGVNEAKFHAVSLECAVERHHSAAEVHLKTMRRDLQQIKGLLEKKQKRAKLADGSTPEQQEVLRLEKELKAAKGASEKRHQGDKIAENVKTAKAKAAAKEAENPNKQRNGR